jgi:hypothetical protein
VRNAERQGWFPGIDRQQYTRLTNREELMSLFKSFSRRLALFAPIAILFAASPTYGQDKPDAKSIVDKIKEGAGLAKVKEMVAASPAGARFRVDGFSLSADSKSIKVTGAMLVPGSNDEERTNAAKLTRNKVMEAVQKTANAEKFEEFDFDSTAGTGSVKEVSGDRLPHLLLQKAANAAGAKNPAADEIKLADAKFDTSGHLVLIGVRGPNPETEKWLTAAIPIVLAENPAAIGPNGKPADANGKKWVQTDKVELFGKGWPVSAAALQKALIQKNSPALSRLRVDRLYFFSTPDKADEANPTGVSWAYALTGIVIGTDPPDAKAITKVCDEMFAAGSWPAMKSGDLEGLTKADFRVHDPGSKFQKSVAGIPLLDGVRVDDRTEFGEDGKLVLTGVQPGLDEKGLKELSDTVVKILNGLAGSSDGNPLYQQLAAHGVSAQKLERIKIRELHSEMRKWVAERLDDVRLTRLYFNEEGKLTLLCDTPPGDEGTQDLTKVTAELIARLATYKFPPSQKGTAPAPPAKDPSPEKSDLNISTVQDTSQAIVKPGPDTFKGSLTKHLQTMVSDPKNPKWIAVLIERGFFNDDNQYIVRGVVNNEEQKKQLTQYIDSLKNESAWSAYFKVPGAAPQLDVIPIAELVARVQRVTPAYSVFDGVRITGAKYTFISDDKSGFAGGLNLVFTAQTVGKPNLYECRVVLADLLSKHPGYSRRLAKSSDPRFPKLRIEGVALPPDSAQNSAANFANGFGASYLARVERADFFGRLYCLARAKEWIDTGLMNDPEQSSIWFLSAYFHFVMGDLELTRRDLYRMLDIESPLTFNGGDQRHRRYDVAKDLQGAKRDELEKLCVECLNEKKNGAKQMTMVPAK